MAGITDVLVRFEKGSDIDCLSAPHLPVDSPVEGQLQGPPVERPANVSIFLLIRRDGYPLNSGGGHAEISSLVPGPIPARRKDKREKVVRYDI